MKGEDQERNLSLKIEKEKSDINYQAGREALAGYKYTAGKENLFERDED